MADDVVDCSKGCSLYFKWENLLHLCRVDRDEELDEPDCYISAILGKPCRYGLSLKEIKEKKSELEEKVGE